ncbi:hypothetical protein NIES4101_25510 (plasmid) [Calothrix sp. NIES-4101]|nr:hypothetical protein NIES4101_25510 [Calothrix sp. NIES-4101]
MSHFARISAATRIESLAKQLSLPNSAIGRGEIALLGDTTKELKVKPFVDSHPFQELTFSTAIAEYLARPLAKLTPEQVAYIDAICTSTLNKQEVMKQVRDFFHPLPGTNNAE